MLNRSLMQVLLLSIAAVVLFASTPGTFAKPLKVYILAGQSNMQGKAGPDTLPAMAKYPESKDLHDKLVDADGNPRVHEEIRIAAVSTRWGKKTTKSGPLGIGYGNMLYGENPTAFGPELAFGVTMHEHLGEPILIIKTSWGGKSLCIDFRPPSAEPYQVQPEVTEYFKSRNSMEKLEESLAGNREKSGVYYKRMIDHVNSVLADPEKYHPGYDPKEGYELAGFVWFQGYNDMIDGQTYKTKGPDAYKKYSRLFAHFIRDVRKDLKAPELPFVIGVLGLGGITDGPFQEAQAAPAQMPEFKDSVVAVRTGKYWDHELAELDKRMADIKKQAGRKSRELGKEGAQKLQQKLIEEKFTDEELKRLENERSNAGFHYLGSAKIYSLIGEAFANALFEMKRK